MAARTPNSDPQNMYDFDETVAGEGDVEINVEDYLKAARRPIEVTRKNKIICTTGFVLLIISICGYVGGLAYVDVNYEIMKALHFKGPSDIIYFLMFSDVVASCVGIWTCLQKTGPQPMIYSCIWLLLSSLINLCVTISLTFETKRFRDERDKTCGNGKKYSDECLAYTKVAVVLWCSLLFFSLKIVIIILCRLNYPQVFNWMMGKDVYVDENLLPDRNEKMISNVATLAGAYFDPPDLARIAARGSLKDTTVIGNITDSQAIFVTREDNESIAVRLEVPDSGESNRGSSSKRPSKKRSTFVSLS